MYLRAHYLPKVLRCRPLVLLLGPRGVGKSSVARRALGAGIVTLCGDRLHEACIKAVRRNRWPEEILHAKLLLIDGPTFLHRRKGVTRLLSQLIAARVQAGLRTAITEGADQSALLLLEAVPPRERVTVNLRFPKRPGRLRLKRQLCQELGLLPGSADELQIDEPWTYRKLVRGLKRLQREQQLEVEEGEHI